MSMNLVPRQIPKLKIKTPNLSFGIFSPWNLPVGPVENIGVEPMTSCVQGRRSSQLS